MNATTLPCSAIQPGKYQPRKFFDSTELEGLAASIKSGGLIQPISVRPVGDNKHEIIAGERRWRAFQMVHGAEGEIPVLIREMSDEQAREMALVENIQRQDMSATEEAVSAGDLYQIFKDKVVVADKLGWKLDKLERRLALLRCVDEVRDALNERKIKLGHAELLATIDPEMQKKVLAGVLANNVTVEALKAQLANFAQKLESAIFDREDCAGCQFNSAMQTSLFAENIGDGSCTHPACFREKTEAKLTSIVTDLKEEVPRVERLGVGDEQIFTIRLIAEGKLGVGADQHTACKGCANYGATVATAPGRMGQIERDICFDSACHTLKVAANIKAVTAAKEQEASAARSQSTATTPTSPTGGAGAVAAKAESVAAVKTTTAPVQAAKPAQRVVDYCDSEWRRVAYLFLKKNPGVSQRFLLWLTLSSNIRTFNSLKFREFFEAETKTQFGGVDDIAEQMGKLDSMEDVQVARMIDTLSHFCLRELEIRKVKGLLGFLDVRMSDYWKVTDKYLTLLTKSEIEAFCKESGLDVKAGDTFSSMLQGKKEALVAAVQGLADQHLIGYVPKVLDYSA